MHLTVNGYLDITKFRRRDRRIDYIPIGFALVRNIENNTLATGVYEHG
jgi:hypothetical protein